MAAEWAVRIGLVSGRGGGRFAPDREQGAHEIRCDKGEVPGVHADLRGGARETFRVRTEEGCRHPPQ